MTTVPLKIHVVYVTQYVVGCLPDAKYKTTHNYKYNNKCLLKSISFVPKVFTITSIF